MYLLLSYIWQPCISVSDTMFVLKQQLRTFDPRQVYSYTTETTTHDAIIESVPRLKFIVINVIFRIIIAVSNRPCTDGHSIVFDSRSDCDAGNNILQHPLHQLRLADFLYGWQVGCVSHSIETINFNIKIHSGLLRWRYSLCGREWNKCDTLMGCHRRW